MYTYIRIFVYVCICMSVSLYMYEFIVALPHMLLKHKYRLSKKQDSYHVSLVASSEILSEEAINET